MIVIENATVYFNYMNRFLNIIHSKYYLIYKSLSPLLTKLPIRDPVFIDEYRTDNKTHRRKHHVRDRHVDILPSKHTRCRQDDVLVPVVQSDIEIVLDFDRIGSWLERGLDSAPQFVEVGSACCPHPDDEVLVLGVDPLN